MIFFYISFIISYTFVFQNVHAEDGAKDVSLLLSKISEESHQILNKDHKVNETVTLKLYYECHCPYCMKFEQTDMRNIINKLNPYLDIKTYPYGHAETNDTNGEITFECQHGPEECYGNKLHACALKHITNYTEALLFNICMMDPKDDSYGSDDATATKCASEMNVKKDPILECAKGKEGSELLKYYGEKTEEADFTGVPHVLVNGVEWDDDLMETVCTAFKNPPEPCLQNNSVKTFD